MDPDQSVPTMFVGDASKTFQQMTKIEDFFFVIGALRVKH